MALAAYRIVQESLTNVVRHADPAVAEVMLGYGSDGRFWVEVVDEGREKPEKSPGAGAGVGIVGMRERAEATGGMLEVGRRPQGGFSVRAQWTERR
jgi:signal transduction histidine kinase